MKISSICYSPVSVWPSVTSRYRSKMAKSGSGKNATQCQVP